MFEPILTVEIPSQRAMKPNGDFYMTPPQTLKLAHSLLSVSKWEAHWGNQAFIGPKKKTGEQLADYILCMSINPISLEVLDLLTEENIADIEAYMDNNACATHHYEDKARGMAGRGVQFFSTELIREQIYYYGLPESCEKWHFNRLISQLKVCQKKETERMSSGKKGGKTGTRSQRAVSSIPGMGG